MTTETTTQPAKRGRKPSGNAMSPAERKRRSRELQQAAAGTRIKQFQLGVQGVHLEYVEALATERNVSTSAVLRGILEPALNRYVLVMQHCDQMLTNGATEQEVVQFINTYWMPELPPMPEAKAN